MPTARDRSADLVPGLEVVHAAADALRDADAAVLVTEWPEFVDLDWSVAGPTMRRRIVIDGRNVLSGEQLAAAGFTYTSFGRGTTMPQSVPEGAVEASARVASLGWGGG
jgi:UDPglucose 6-dehydrogenase